MVINFRVIEQNTSEKEKKEYEYFIKLYNEGLTVKEILSETGLTKYKYNKHKQEALCEGRIKSRQKHENPKYYYETPCGNYIITRRNPKTNRIMSYGTYVTEKEAQEKVKELIMNDWECVNLEF